MRHQWRLALVFATAALFAACGGGGGGGSIVVPVGVTNAPENVATLTIKIPQPSTASAARLGKYVSPGTQSIGVVVAPQGLPTEPPQYVNVANCPTVSGVVTCSINVTVWVGNDTFTITAYSAQNGGGSVLSVGSTIQNVVSGGTPPTVTVSLGGVIASITVTALNASLPLGQIMNVNVAGKDASGATIVGAYQNPIALAGNNLVVTPTSLPDSTTAANVSVAWTQGYLGAVASALTGTAGTVTGSLTVNPASGFAFYNTGSNPTTDVSGFKMIAGPNGDLYYTTIGPITCALPSGFCTTSSGAVHQFNPMTFVDSEVALQSQGVGMRFTSDGALWIAGGVPPSTPGPTYIYRMAPGSFSAAALTAIPVPTPSPSNRNATIRSIAEDGSGNVWFVDGGGGRYMQIPAIGPYTTSSIVQHYFPNGIAGTIQAYGRSRTIDYAAGVLVATDWINGSVDVINPSTGAVVGQYLTALQSSFGANGSLTTSDPYDSTIDGTNVYIGQIGDGNAAEPNGDLEMFNPTTHAFTVLPTVAGPAAAAPLVSSVTGNLIYYADYFLGGVGVINVSAGKARIVPIATYAITGGLNNQPFFQVPQGVVALADGTAWYTCQGAAVQNGVTAYLAPLCLAHTVYVAQWGLWPSAAISINGAGLALAQIMGIMESPSSDSSPFTVTSSNTAICSIANQKDHNFTIVGVTAGACTVTVKDKNGISQSASVVVTTAMGTVQSRVLGGTPK